MMMVHSVSHWIASSLLLLLVTTTVVQGQEKPELSFGLKAPNVVSSKSFWGGPLQPSLQFTKCATAANCNLAAGLDLAEVRPGSVRYSLFGRVQRSFGRWNIRSRLDALSTDLTEVRGFVQSVTPTGCILLAEGFVNPRSAAVTSVNLEQPFQLVSGVGSLGLRLPIERAPPPAPEPSFFSKYIWGVRAPPPSKAPFNPSMTLRYNRGKTGLFLSGNQKRQSLTVQQRVLPRTFLAPTIATDGTWSVSATQSVGSGGSLNAVVRPGDSLTLSYGQYPLQASLVWATGGRGATVFVKRSVPAFS